MPWISRTLRINRSTNGTAEAERRRPGWRSPSSGPRPQFPKTTPGAVNAPARRSSEKSPRRWRGYRPTRKARPSNRWGRRQLFPVPERRLQDPKDANNWQCPRRRARPVLPRRRTKPRLPLGPRRGPAFGICLGPGPKSRGERYESRPELRTIVDSWIGEWWVVNGES